MLLITAAKDQLKQSLGTSPKSSEMRHDKRQEREMLVLSALHSLELLNESTWPVLSRHAPWVRGADLNINVLDSASVIVEHDIRAHAGGRSVRGILLNQCPLSSLSLSLSLSIYIYSCICTIYFCLVLCILVVYS